MSPYSILTGRKEQKNWSSLEPPISAYLVKSCFAESSRWVQVPTNPAITGCQSKLDWFKSREIIQNNIGRDFGL